MEKEEGQAKGAARHFPPSLVLVGFHLPHRVGKGKREGEGKGGNPLLLVLIGLLPKGGAPAPCGLVCFLLMAHKAHNFSRGVPVTSRYSGKMPEPFGTIPMSKCNLPIYESLSLDHFETPRHVSDLIRDSEQTSVHQIT